jgi:hypothetical protein
VAARDARREFFVVMEGDHDVGAAPRVQNSLRSGLPLSAPASPEQRCKHTFAGKNPRPSQH